MAYIHIWSWTELVVDFILRARMCKNSHGHYSVDIVFVQGWFNKDLEEEEGRTAMRDLESGMETKTTHR